MSKLKLTYTNTYYRFEGIELSFTKSNVENVENQFTIAFDDYLFSETYFTYVFSGLSNFKLRNYDDSLLFSIKDEDK